MAVDVDQCAVCMLAVQLNQQSRKLAQHGKAHRLIIDGGATGPITRLHPAHNDIAFHFNFVSGQKFYRHMFFWKIVTGGHTALVLAVAHQIGVATCAKGEAQGIKQDRFSGTGFARQNGQAARQLEVKFFDQNDIANGESSQHGWGYRLIWSDKSRGSWFVRE